MTAITDDEVQDIYDELARRDAALNVAAVARTLGIDLSTPGIADGQAAGAAYLAAFDGGPHTEAAARSWPR